MGSSATITNDGGRSRYLQAVAAGRPATSYPDLYGPPFRDGDVGAVIVSRYADAVQVLTDPVTFSNQLTLFPLCYVPTDEAMGTVAHVFMGCPPLVSKDGEAHRVERVPTVKAFPRNPQHVAPFLGEVLDDIVATVRERASTSPDGTSEVELMEVVAKRLTTEVMRRTIGLSDEAAHEVMASAAGEFELVWGDPDPDEQLTFARDMAIIWRRSAEAVDHWEAVDEEERPDNYIARILAHGFSSDEAKASVFNIVSASHTTTTAGIGNVIEEALSREGTWRELHDHPDRVGDFVAEGLRMSPPAHGWLRVVHENATDAVVGGVRLEPGERLLVLLGAANRDPDRPDASPDLTFSTGPHRCPGASQAQFLIEQTVARLTAELPEMALSGRPPVHVANVAFNIHEELWVTVHPTP